METLSRHKLHLPAWFPRCPASPDPRSFGHAAYPVHLRIYLSLSLLLGHFVCRAVEIRTSKLNICSDVKVLLVTTLLSTYV